MITFCYNSLQFDISDIALQLELVKNKKVVNTEQHDATDVVALLEVSELAFKRGLLYLHV